MMNKARRRKFSLCEEQIMNAVGFVPVKPDLAVFRRQIDGLTPGLGVSLLNNRFVRQFYD